MTDDIVAQVKQLDQLYLDMDAAWQAFTAASDRYRQALSTLEYDLSEWGSAITAMTATTGRTA